MIRKALLPWLLVFGAGMVGVPTALADDASPTISLISTSVQEPVVTPIRWGYYAYPQAYGYRAYYGPRYYTYYPGYYNPGYYRSYSYASPYYYPGYSGYYGSYYAPYGVYYSGPVVSFGPGY